MNKEPEEMNNLADEPMFQAKKKELFNSLQQLQTQYADTLDLATMKL